MPRKETNKTGGTKARRKPTKPRITPGTANVVEAPGGLRRFFRFSQLAVGEAGATRKIEDIWATVLAELEDSGVPAEARSRIESLGGRTMLGRGARLPESVIKLAGGKENALIIKETLRAAREATKGVSPAALEKQVKSFIDLLAKEANFQTDDGRRIIAELRKASPAAIARVGATQTVSALASRGSDPFVVSMYRKALKKTPTAVLPDSLEATLREASAGKLPKVASTTRKALGIELAGVGKGANVARKAAGFLGKSALGAVGIGVTAALEIGRAKDILGREGRAKKLALTGFAEAGPSSSVEFLRDTVRQQESIARRKATMQQFEPELFDEIIRTLSDTGQSKSTLTSTERRIGSDSRTGAQSRGRDPEDVKFLLDQLFSQMTQ